MQVHPRELRSQNQRVQIVLEASKSAGAKGGVLKIAGLCNRCTRAKAFPDPIYIFSNSSAEINSPKVTQTRECFYFLSFASRST